MEYPATRDGPKHKQSGWEAGGLAQFVTFDPLLPAAVAARAEQSGVKKASTDALTVLVLAILAGAFISFGAIFATTVGAGSISVTAADGTTQFTTGLPYGVTKLLVGLAFSVGLILVLVGGAELFTGNTMIVMAWANHKVSSQNLLFNWLIVFCGNFVGAFLTAVLLFYSTQYTFGGGAVGLSALYTAHSKAALGFIPAVALGILCNALVCLAVWMCYGARTTLEKIFAIIPPVAAFIAAGFEHSIANIYYFSIALFIKAGAPDTFWTSIHKTPADFPALTWQNFLIGNLLPVTIGNIIGGSIMVGAVYWFVYLRRRID
ncbi:MAG: formate transporter FocA [Alphaproteobacteria bacterium]|nr:MAG: formate transporter FocA [Alphaproteobacteria bacterium]